MPIYEITNGGFTAQIDSLGAQLVSLRDKAGREYLWQGDPAYWEGRAPVLFPIVGALREGRAKINGEWFGMKQHGFARHKGFGEAHIGEGQVSLTLRDDEETRQMYPFGFALTVTYTLAKGCLRTAFLVENTGGEPLPYAIGGHPGFNLPLEEGAVFEDYVLQFDQEEAQQCPSVLLDVGLLDYQTPGFRLEGQREIPLRHSLFYQDALVFSGLLSHRVRVLNKATGKGVEMDFSGFPMLGVWSARNDGPYVCLEPWTGCATLTTEGDNFTEKRGMALLKPGASAEHAFSVEILPGF